MLIQRAGQRVLTIPGDAMQVIAPRAGAPQYYVIFNATTTVINCGSDASLDDLPDNIFTAEVWARADGLGEVNYGVIMAKAVGWLTGGWYISCDPAKRLRGFVKCTTNTSLSETADDSWPADSNWCHIAFFFDDAGDRKVYIAIDGVWEESYEIQYAGVGAIVTDASGDLTIGNNLVGSRAFDGAIGWCRISNNDRYSHESGFTPPARNAPPAVDGNTVEQWNLNEGQGTNAAAQVNSPTSDGTITDGAWGSF